MKFLELTQTWQDFIKFAKQVQGPIKEVCNIFLKRAKDLELIDFGNSTYDKKFFQPVNSAITKLKRDYPTQTHSLIDDTYAKILMIIFINLPRSECPKYIRDANYFVVILFSGTSARILYFPTKEDFEKSAGYATWNKEKIYAGYNYFKALAAVDRNDFAPGNLVKII